MADLELHLRLFLPAAFLAVEEMVEELQLQLAAVVGVEMGPVLDAVHLEPFLLRRRLHEALEVAARMERLAAPIGGRQQRHLDLRPHRRAGAVIVVIERMGEDRAAEIGAVRGEFLLAERLRPAHELAVDRRAAAAFAGAVLHGLDLHVVPVLPERAQNAAVARHVAIPIGRALPNADRREVRRLERGDVPLVDAVIGNAVEPDLAVRPRLHACPFDAVVEILGLARREMLDDPRRAAAAA